MNQVTTAAQYFSALGDAWNRATQVWCPELQCFMQFGDIIVRLRFSDTLLYEAYLPALDRARMPEAMKSWDAEICIMRNMPGSELPTPRWSSGDHIPRGEVPSLSDGNIRSAYNIQTSVLSSYCNNSRVGFHCVRDFNRLKQYEFGAPLRDIISWILQDHGAQLVHGAAVGYASGGVLLAGRGGSGKSTTATSCLGQGLKYLADDYCLLHKVNGTWWVGAVYDSIKLCSHDAVNNPILEHYESSYSQETGKNLFFIQRDMERYTCNGFPLKAIVLPKLNLGTTAYSHCISASKSIAIQALAPSTLFQLPCSRAKSFHLMSSVVKEVPAFELILGSDRARVSASIVELLDRL